MHTVCVLGVSRGAEQIDCPSPHNDEGGRQGEGEGDDADYRLWRESHDSCSLYEAVSPAGTAALRGTACRCARTAMRKRRGG